MFVLRVCGSGEISEMFLQFAGGDTKMHKFLDSLVQAVFFPDVSSAAELSSAVDATRLANRSKSHRSGYRCDFK